MNFLLSIPATAWLVLSALCFAFGEFLSKKFALAPSWAYVGAIVCVYMFGTLTWLPAILQKNQLSITGAIWSVMSLLATVLIGILLFGERLSPLDIIGIVCAFAAIALLSFA